MQRLVARSSAISLSLPPRTCLRRAEPTSTNSFPVSPRIDLANRRRTGEVERLSPRHEDRGLAFYNQKHVRAVGTGAQ